jgi:sporulation protein YlmC with PRC-barrel domain
MNTNKIAVVIGLIICFGLGFLASSVYYSKKFERSFGREYVMSEVIGTEVKNPQGEDYGKISDLVVDTNGRVPFAILVYGEKSVAIPFGLLKYNREGKHLVLNFEREKLDSAPSFDKNQLANRTWVEDNYKHFGQAPYWTNGDHMTGSSETTEHTLWDASGTKYTWP